jgi:hypothetical protein
MAPLIDVRQLASQRLTLVSDVVSNGISSLTCAKFGVFAVATLDVGFPTL